MRRLLFLIAILWGAPCAGASDDPQIRRLSQELIPRLMQAAEVPGLSAALLRDGRVVWTGAYGVRSAESGEPVLEDTIFNAASLSKPAVAAAVLQRAARGEFDLDRPLWETLPYPRLAHDQRARKITARMVLSHRTGLPNWGGTPLEMIDPPGERWGYSGEGFVYLQKVLEKSTGLTLNELVAREVFEPLGMHDSSFVWREDFEGRMARGHDDWGEVQGERRPEEANAAASLATTASDYARFLAGLMSGKLRAPGTLEQMAKGVGPVARWGDPSTHQHVDWGLGWGIQRGERGPGLWHWGDNGDFRCYVLFYPETRDGVVYFTNSGNGLAIARPLVSTLYEDTHWPLEWLNYEPYDDPKRVARRQLQRLFLEDAGKGMKRLEALRSESPEIVDEPMVNQLGYFLLGRDRTDDAVAVFRANLEQHGSANAHDSLAEGLLEAGDTSSALEHLEKAAALEPDNENFPRRLQWVRDIRKAAAEPVAASEERLGRLAGRYGPRKVELRDGRLHYERDGTGREYPLTPMSEEVFLLEGLASFRLRFVLDEQGNPTALAGVYFNGRTDQFEREAP